MSIFRSILSSPAINKGLIGKVKDYLYDKLIADKKDGKTDLYRTEILSDFSEIFQDYDWILASGSCLRYYRDQTMAGQDIDILLRYEDFLQEKAKLAQRGYSLLAEFSDEEKRCSEVKLKYKKAEIDIIFVFHDNEGFYYLGSYEDENHKDQLFCDYGDGKRIVHGEGYGSYRKDIPDFQCAEYEFQGMKFKSYQNIEEHLFAEYGKEWKIPDPNFSFLAGPTNNKPQKVCNAQVIYYYDSLKEY